MSLTVNGTKVRQVYTNGAKTKVVTCNGVVVYRAGVTVTNVFTADMQEETSWSDVGYDRMELWIKTFSVTAGHRYFVRGQLWGYARPNSDLSSFTGQLMIGDDVMTSYDVASLVPLQGKTVNYIYTAGSSGTIPLKVTGTRVETDQGTLRGIGEMFVDLTEAESLRGSRYTADGFYSAAGKFYGNKDIDV